MNYFVKYRIALIAFGALLITLFVCTSLFFYHMDQQLDAAAEEAIRNAQKQDQKGTAQSLQKVRAIFDSKKWTLKLLLDHEEVDKLEIALEKAERAVSLNDMEEALYALDELRSIALYIGQIELPLLTNIF